MDFPPILLSSLITVEEKGFLEKGKIWRFETFFFSCVSSACIIYQDVERRRIKEYKHVSYTVFRSFEIFIYRKKHGILLRYIKFPLITTIFL